MLLFIILFLGRTCEHALPQIKTYPTNSWAPTVGGGLQFSKINSNDRRRVTNPINQLRWVGWWVLSSKTSLNQPDWNLTKIWQFKLFLVSFWSKYFRFNEIYDRFRDISPNLVRSQPNLVEISSYLARSHQIQWDLWQIWQNFVWKKLFWPNFSTVDGLYRPLSSLNPIALI